MSLKNLESFLTITRVIDKLGKKTLNLIQKNVETKSDYVTYTKIVSTGRLQNYFLRSDL